MAPSTLLPPSPKTHTLKPTTKPHAKPPSIEPNVLEVVFGSLLIKPWYPSFYPEELVGRTVERLYVCQWCFKYSRELMGFLGHLRGCERRVGGVPGACVYRGRKGGVGAGAGNGGSVGGDKGVEGEGEFELWEIDGGEFKTYAQNLSLFAKLFLDTKSVFYDVTTFLYYLLVTSTPNPSINTSLPSTSSPPPKQQQVVGFFSKEKMSWDNNNLACILVFPPWQKQGLGQILMGASYEISKREGRLGGPEKPLSDLGRRGYMHFWSASLARAILSAPSKKTITVMDLRNETYIVPEDIIATLQSMEVLEHKKRGGAQAVINKAKVRAWVEMNHVDMKPPVDPDDFIIYREDEEEVEEGEGDDEMEE